jgi:hypothetical protein
MVDLFICVCVVLERLNVRGLPTLGPLYDVKLDGLTFLQTLEAIRADGRVVHEDIFTILARDETEPFRVVKPFHCSLFHVMLFPKLNCAGANRSHKRAETCCWARTALARFRSNATLFYQILLVTFSVVTI